MARSKLRKSNSALSRGQMVRIENRFTLRLEEDTYDPDAIGTCCTANADGEMSPLEHVANKKVILRKVKVVQTILVHVI